MEELIHSIIKSYLNNTPHVEEPLPHKWERRFGLVGRFMQYASLEHALSKNKVDLETNDPYCWSAYWRKLIKLHQDGDEIWIHGNDDGVAIYLIRGEEKIYCIPKVIH